MFSPAVTDINPFYLGNRMKRFMAFCIDIFPIHFVTIMIYRQFSDYDAVLESYISDPNDEEFKAAFVAILNRVGMIGGGIYILYCFLMEASVHQATFGKQLMRLKVVNTDGSILTPKEAFWRNAFKIFSHAAFSIGFFWILFDSQKRGWHDIMGKTLVVDANYESEIPEQLMQQLEEIKDEPYRNTASTLTNSNFNTLKEGNQSNLLYPADINAKDFQLIKSETPNPKERLRKYKALLVDDMLSSNKEIPDDLIWNNSTHGQKLLRVFTTFDDHLTSTGLFSFLFHNSEFMFAMVEVLKETGPDRLLQDYTHVVGEFGSKMEIFTANRKTYEYPLTSEKEKQAALQTVKDAITSVGIIEAYYFDTDFQQELYQHICAYVESNEGMYIRSNS